jgi:hypothetical protein
MKYNNYSLTYQINDRSLTQEVTSQSFTRGKNEVTFSNSLFKNDEMLETGLIIRPFPSYWYKKIEIAISYYVISLLQDNNVDTANFTLEKYHKYVDNKIHSNVIASFRAGMLGIGGVHLNKLGIPYKELDEFVNTEINATSNLSCVYKRLIVPIKHFWIRIVRPGVAENNPPHKDTHVGRIQKCVNIYLPLAGSNDNSSLPLIPGTHLEKENEYIISGSPSYINNRKYTVPAIVHRNKGLKMITPNPKPHEIMIFTPHLIHGGGANNNEDITRVSLEMRFFK